MDELNDMGRLMKSGDQWFGQLSADLHSAQRVVGTALIELNSELGRNRNQVERSSQLVADQAKGLVEELARLRTQLDGASAASSRQSSALVRWTVVLVLVTAAYTILTGGMLLVAWRQLDAARSQAQSTVTQPGK